tara:strand:+ start:81 stop:452 length:372 start_codon:yes stop_codon:yes gene_type:complete
MRRNIITYFTLIDFILDVIVADEARRVLIKDWCAAGITVKDAVYNMKQAYWKWIQQEGLTNLGEAAAAAVGAGGGKSRSMKKSKKSKKSNKGGWNYIKIKNGTKKRGKRHRATAGVPRKKGKN